MMVLTELVPEIVKLINKNGPLRIMALRARQDDAFDNPAQALCREPPRPS